MGQGEPDWLAMERAIYKNPPCPVDEIASNRDQGERQEFNI
jgi:hypothetical protein